MADIPQKRASKIDEKFIVEENTLKRAVNDNPKDKIEIEIGDAKQPDFKPQAKIMRWDNEVNFSLRAEEHPEAVVQTEGKLIKYITPDYEVHQYELDSGEIGESGGLEFEWVLPQKPASNVLTATIQTKELDFFYQPALTQKEIDEGASRPENVVGSYAVYHKTKGGMNRADGMEYKTGKAFHIYRPKAIDAKGNESWAELNIDQEKELLTIVVPGEFLDGAVYPVVVDPTMGYTSIGASEVGASYIYGSLFSAAQSGQVASITSYTKGEGGSRNLGCAIYSDSSNNPVSKLAEDGANISIDTAFSWDTVNISLSITSSSNYWLCDWASGSRAKKYDSGAANQSFHDGGGNSFETWPGTMTGETFLSFKFSTYATYTADGYQLSSASNLTYGLDEDGGSASTTASIAPTSNALLLASVTSRTGITADPNEPTFTGNGLTWVKINTIVWDTTSSSRKRTTLFRAMGASPSSGAASIDFGGQAQTDVIWAIDQFTNVDTSGTHGSGAIVQSATNKDETATQTTFSVTLSAFSNANNFPYGVLACDRGDFGVPTGILAELSQQLESNLSQTTDWVNSEVTSVGFSGPGIPGGYGGVAVEIKPAIVSTETSSERGAVATGKDTTNSARAAHIVGQDSANSTRAAVIRGVDTTNSARAAKITGKDTSNAARGAKITGVDGANSARAAHVVGKDTSSATRAAHLLGAEGSNSARGAKLAGIDTTNNTRAAHLVGKETANATRGAHLVGQAAANDTRAAHLVGKDASNASRAAHVVGKQTDNNTRAAKITGNAAANDARAAHLVGVLAANATRGAHLVGKDSANAARAAHITGILGADSARSAHLVGFATSSATRAARLSGIDTATSTRGARLTGVNRSDSSRGARLTGTNWNNKARQNWYDPDPQAYYTKGNNDWYRKY